MTTMNNPSLWQALTGWAVRRLSESVEARSVVLESVHPSQDPPASWLDSPSSGVVVTPDTAMTNAAVYACVRVLAESVASLPLKLYRRRADGGKELAASHSLYSVLHDLANSEITSFELRETLMMHVALRGNAYCELDINGRGDVLGLWPITPWRVTMKRHADGGLYYHVALPQGGEAMLPQYRVWHIRGLSQNGLQGMSPIAIMRRAIGLALTTEDLGTAYYGNGASPGGTLEYPGKLSDQAYEKIKGSWEGRHQGVSKANRIAILEEGLKFTAVGLNMADAQFLETRKFQKAEIASIFRVPPHMIGDLERATFSNIEQQSIDFVVNTLRPWLVRIEQSITRDLIGPIERAQIFAEFSVDGLLRGDIASRYNAYAIGRNNGWLSPNDVRLMENMNPIDGGDTYSTPLNMAPLGKSDSKTPAANTNSARAMLQPVVEATMARILRREVQDVVGQYDKLVKRGQIQQFGEWMETFCDGHREWMVEQLIPVALTACRLRGEDPEIWVDPTVSAIVDERLAKLRARRVMPNMAHLADEVDRVLDGCIFLKGSNLVPKGIKRARHEGSPQGQDIFKALTRPAHASG